MGSYDDIIHQPHHVSSSRTPMPITDRAAQFSPFAAEPLTNSLIYKNSFTVNQTMTDNARVIVEDRQDVNIARRKWKS